MVIKGGPNVRINPDASNAALKTMDPGKDATAKGAAAGAVQQGLAAKYQGLAKKLGGQAGVPPALVLGLMSRESGFGSLLDAQGYGDHGNGYGILQVDKNAHTPVTDGGFDGEGHTTQAMGVLTDAIDTVRQAHPLWTSDQQLARAVALYNGGQVPTQPTNPATWEHMDKGTTGKDYSRDVWARAQWFADHLIWEQNAGRLGDPSSGHDACPATAATQGSKDVYFNDKPALRVHDPFAPHACKKHKEHVGLLKEGSSVVSIDGATPAVHVGHRVDCGGHLQAGSPDVFIGG